MSHTPGPWELQTSCSYRRIGSGGSDGNVLYAVTHASDGHPDLCWPNGGFEGPDAMLMLAAPELLEALKEIAPILAEKGQNDDYLWALYSRAIAAITQAEGKEP